MCARAQAERQSNTPTGRRSSAWFGESASRVVIAGPGKDSCLPLQCYLTDTDNSVAFGFPFPCFLCTLHTFSPSSLHRRAPGKPRSARASFLTHARNRSRFLTVTKQISAAWHCIRRGVCVGPGEGSWAGQMFIMTGLDCAQ